MSDRRLRPGAGILAAVAALALSCAHLRAEDGGAEPPQPPKVQGPEEDGEKPAANFGDIWTYKTSRRIIATGSICLDKGPLEYFACFRGGKDYESVIAVDAKPEVLNLAFIAQNFQARGGVKVVGDPRAPQGDPVLFFVEWESEPGKRKRIRAEELLYNVRTKKPMKETAWVYTGSEFFTDEETGKEVFAAAVTGVLAAVYRDPSAIFNSPLDTGVDDTYYEVNPDVCPKKGTKVLVIFAPAKKEDVKTEDGGSLPAPEGAGAGAGVKPEDRPAAPAPEVEK